MREIVYCLEGVLVKLRLRVSDSVVASRELMLARLNMREEVEETATKLEFAEERLDVTALKKG